MPVFWAGSWSRWRRRRPGPAPGGAAGAVGQQEVAQVVDAEGRLDAVFGRPGRAGELDAGVADQGGERRGGRGTRNPSANRRIEPCEARSRAIARTSGFAASAASRLAAASDRSRLRPARMTCQPPAGSQDRPAHIRSPGRSFPPGHDHRPFVAQRVTSPGTWDPTNSGRFQASQLRPSPPLASRYWPVIQPDSGRARATGGAGDVLDLADPAEGASSSPPDRRTPAGPAIRRSCRWRSGRGPGC